MTIRRMNRRTFLRLAGSSLAGTALLGTTGCGGGQSGATQKIIFSNYEDPSFEKLVNEFNKQREGEIRVAFRPMPADSGQHFDRLRTEFQAGGGDIDVIGGDVIWPAQFAAQDWIVDLSDRFTTDMRDEFLEGDVNANTWEGKVWGVPWITGAGMLYYRKDLLEKSGFSEPPGTWEELKEMALKVKQDQGIKNGFVFQGANYEGGVCNGLEYIWTHGGDVLDSDSLVIDSPETVAGLATERSMIEDGVAPEAVGIYEEAETEGVFLQGDSVFCRNWAQLYGLVGDPSASRIRPEQIGIVPLPASHEGGTRTGTVGATTLLINAASDKQDAAWEFIRYLSAPEQMRQNALEAAYLPPRYSLYEDEELAERVPVMEVGREALLSATPRPVSPFYADMSLEMAEQFNASLSGDVSPEQAVQTLDARLKNIIEQAS